MNSRPEGRFTDDESCVGEGTRSAKRTARGPHPYRRAQCDLSPVPSDCRGPFPHQRRAQPRRSPDPPRSHHRQRQAQRRAREVRERAREVIITLRPRDDRRDRHQSLNAEGERDAGNEGREQGLAECRGHSPLEISG